MDKCVCLFGCLKIAKAPGLTIAQSILLVRADKVIG